MLRTSTIHVVDPDPVTAEGVRDLLHATSVQVQAYATAKQFLATLSADRPACVVMELALPDQCGLKLLETIRGNVCPMPVIILTSQATVRSAVDAMLAGAMFVLEKPADAGSLQRLIAGGLQRDVEVVRECAERKRLNARFAMLSPREREVAELIFQGLETKVIAARLGISPKTVEYHRAQIFAKMEVTNAVQLTVAMLRHERPAV